MKRRHGLVADNHGAAPGERGDPRARLREQPAPNDDIIGRKGPAADRNHRHDVASPLVIACAAIQVFNAFKIASTASP